METHLSIKEKEQENLTTEGTNLDNIQEIVKILQPSLSRSTQVKNPPKRYDDFVSFFALISNKGNQVVIRKQ